MKITTEELISAETAEEIKYATARRERQEHVDAILRSPSKKKIVVAGPGTGKTHLFKTLIKGKNQALVLTFVNALVEDLSLALCGLAEVRTLHSFARGLLAKVPGADIKVFSRLSAVIREDAKILLNQAIDFDHLFHNRHDYNDAQNVHIEFYKQRKKYYGHYGFSDMVFGAVKYLEKDKSKIPRFPQVLVDEFQDFNAQEVSLIDLLAENSCILLVGDDDQALYESLKRASSQYIRQRYTGSDSSYAVFCLPHCSRCTRVVVDATNDVVARAIQNGYLRSRIDKPFRYFDDKTKDVDSSNNPKIIYTRCFENQIPSVIRTRIEETASEVRGKFTVLIISPTRLKVCKVAESLKRMGFKNLQVADRNHPSEPTLLDGLKLLLENGSCNLGWRLVLRKVLEPGAFKSVIPATYGLAPRNFVDLIDVQQKRTVKKMLATLRTIRNGKDPDRQDLAFLLDALGFDGHAMARDALKDELMEGAGATCRRAVKGIEITATTVPSAKGLAADYVFITHFDDRYFIRDKSNRSPTDQEICRFLVALTRAKKKVFLISSNTKKTPLFLEWIDKERIAYPEHGCCEKAGRVIDLTSAA